MSNVVVQLIYGVFMIYISAVATVEIMVNFFLSTIVYLLPV